MGVYQLGVAARDRGLCVRTHSGTRTASKPKRTSEVSCVFIGVVWCGVPAWRSHSPCMRHAPAEASRRIEVPQQAQPATATAAAPAAAAAAANPFAVATTAAANPFAKATTGTFEGAGLCYCSYRCVDTLLALQRLQPTHLQQRLLPTRSPQQPPPPPQQTRLQTLAHLPQPSRRASLAEGAQGGGESLDRASGTKRTMTMFLSESHQYFAPKTW